MRSWSLAYLTAVLQHQGARVGASAMVGEPGSTERRHQSLDNETGSIGAQAAVWVAEDSCPDYMLKAEACLKQEEERVGNYLHISTKPKLLEEVSARSGRLSSPYPQIAHRHALACLLQQRITHTAMPGSGPACRCVVFHALFSRTASQS